MQCYPSDAEVNKCISEMEVFGWELISNQRCQEFEGQSTSGDTVTNHYSTFNKLTFQRDKEARWYNEIRELESEYNTTRTELSSIYAQEPKNGYVKASIFIGIVLSIFYIIPGIIYAVYKSVQKKKMLNEYYVRHKNWEDKYRAQINAMCAKLAAIEEKAQEVIAS